MPTVHLIARSGDAPIKNAWFYVKQGNATTTLRSDADGQLLASAGEADSGSSGEGKPVNPATKIPSFVKPFAIEVPTTIQIAYSRGGLVIPAAFFEAVPSAATKIDLDLKPEDAPHPVPVAVAPNDLNTVKAVPTIELDLPPVPVTFDEPAALQVWPMLTSPFPDEYETSELAQGAALWPAQGASPVTDGEAATAAADPDWPRDLGVRVRGAASNGAPKVDLYLLDATGARLKFRLAPDAKAEAAVDVVTAEVKTVAGAARFETTFFPHDPAHFFGLVQVVAVTKGGGPDGLGDVVAELLGVQLGLCDDGMQGEDGDIPGPCVGPAQETNVIDFVVTAVSGPLPHQDLPKKTRTTRSRRPSMPPFTPPRRRWRSMVARAGWSASTFTPRGGAFPLAARPTRRRPSIRRCRCGWPSCSWWAGGATRVSCSSSCARRLWARRIAR